MKLGLQLYTLRDLMKEDFTGVLQQVAKLGYEGVEFAGYGGMTADSLRGVVQELGLAPVSSHVSLDRLENHLEEELTYAKALGLAYVICPFLPESRRSTRADYLRLAEVLNGIGQRCQEAGVGFGYHNHAFEFDPMDEVGYPLDDLLQHTNAQWVNAELDVYWVEYGGAAAVDYLNRYAGRCPIIHIKDMDATDRSFREVGQGTLNMLDIFSAAKAAGTQWLVVEQDVCKGDPLQSVRESLTYAKELQSKINQ